MKASSFLEDAFFGVSYLFMHFELPND